MNYSTPTKLSYKRINLTLPLGTIQLLEKNVKKGDRSAFVDTAVRSYIDAIGRSNLRTKLAEGAQKRSVRDLTLGEDWFSIDEELWHNNPIV